MNENKQKLKLPIHLLVLDAIGAVLVGLGFVDWFADTNLVPSSFQFENYYIVMVVIGILLMLPAMGYLLKFAFGKLPRDI